LSEQGENQTGSTGSTGKIFCLSGRKAEGSYQNQNEQCLLIEEVPGQDEQDKQELIFGYPEEKQKEVIIEIW
jgi:hypothetical protein